MSTMSHFLLLVLALAFISYTSGTGVEMESSIEAMKHGLHDPALNSLVAEAHVAMKPVALIMNTESSTRSNAAMNAQAQAQAYAQQQAMAMAAQQQMLAQQAYMQQQHAAAMEQQQQTEVAADSTLAVDSSSLASLLSEATAALKHESQMKKEIDRLQNIIHKHQFRAKHQAKNAIKQKHISKKSKTDVRFKSSNKASNKASAKAHSKVESMTEADIQRVEAKLTRLRQQLQTQIEAAKKSKRSAVRRAAVHTEAAAAEGNEPWDRESPRSGDSYSLPSPAGTATPYTFLTPFSNVNPLSHPGAAYTAANAHPNTPNMGGAAGAWGHPGAAAGYYGGGFGQPHYYDPHVGHVFKGALFPYHIQLETQSTKKHEAKAETETETETESKAAEGNEPWDRESPRSGDSYSLPSPAGTATPYTFLTPFSNVNPLSHPGAAYTAGHAHPGAAVGAAAAGGYPGAFGPAFNHPAVYRPYPAGRHGQYYAHPNPVMMPYYGMPPAAGFAFPNFKHHIQGTFTPGYAPHFNPLNGQPHYGPAYPYMPYAMHPFGWMTQGDGGFLKKEGGKEGGEAAEAE